MVGKDALNEAITIAFENYSKLQDSSVAPLSQNDIETFGPKLSL